MEIGDLVEVLVFQVKSSGVVVNIYTNHKNKLQAVDVLLSNGEIKNVGTWAVEVVSESR